MSGDIRKRLEEHRNQSMICCEESCWCWDVEALLTGIDRLKTEDKSLYCPTCEDWKKAWRLESAAREQAEKEIAELKNGEEKQFARRLESIAREELEIAELKAEKDAEIADLKADVGTLREALEEIAAGSDDIDFSGNKNLPFDGDLARKIAQDALLKGGNDG